MAFFRPLDALTAAALVTLLACGRTGLLEDGVGSDFGGGPNGGREHGDDAGAKRDAADADAGLDASDPSEPATIVIGPKVVPNEPQIVAGFAHACLRDKKSRVFCWGVNNQGQLGIGPTALSAVAVQVTGLPEIVRLAAGYNHTCALAKDLSMWCWGSDLDGELGNGARAEAVATPQRVVGLPAPPVAIAASGWHTCSLDQDGNLACWGRNTSGECGVEGADRFLSPTPVVSVGAGLGALALGTWHTCVALPPSGDVRCFGRNSDGQLGTGGSGQFETRPQSVLNLSDVTFMAAGDDHTCAIRGNGETWCWGDGFLGELGDGLGQRHSTPGRAGIAGAVHLAGGIEHTCAVVGGGKVRCWGKGLQGQLGSGDIVLLEALPVDVRGIGDAVQVATGSEFSCAAHATRGAACWGASGNGELGHGTGDPEFQTTPVEVQGLD